MRGNQYFVECYCTLTPTRSSAFNSKSLAAVDKRGHFPLLARFKIQLGKKQKESGTERERERDSTCVFALDFDSFIASFSTGSPGWATNNDVICRWILNEKNQIEKEANVWQAVASGWLIKMAHCETRKGLHFFIDRFELKRSTQQESKRHCRPKLNIPKRRRRTEPFFLFCYIERWKTSCRSCLNHFLYFILCVWLVCYQGGSKEKKNGMRGNWWKPVRRIIFQERPYGFPSNRSLFLSLSLCR